MENQHLFRQINVFTKEVTKELISQKIFEVIAFSSTFHHTVWKLREFTRESNSFTKEITK